MSRRLQYLQFGDTCYATNMSWVGSWDESPKEKPIQHQISPEIARLDKFDQQEAKLVKQYRAHKISAVEFERTLNVLNSKREATCKRLEKLGYFPEEEIFEEPLDIPKELWFNIKLGSFGRIMAFIVVIIAVAFTNLCFAEDDDSYEQAICLAKNAFFEAQGEGILGKKAVTWVVINRANKKQWPSTPCDVVYEPSSDPKRPKACKFSWYCDGRPDTIPVEENEIWAKAIIVSWEILNGYDHFDPTFGATHYVRCGVQKVWMKDLVFKTAIGGHCFYGE